MHIHFVGSMSDESVWVPVAQLPNLYRTARPMVRVHLMPVPIHDCEDPALLCHLFQNSRRTGRGASFP